MRVLYVDDEDDIREVAALSLGLDPELEINVCASGSEALAKVREWAPDIILLDVMMPGMDGPETLAKLREIETTAETPVVFITARTQAYEIERFLSLGAVGVIAKPFDPLGLPREVRDHMPGVADVA
ncbi:response regulator receiver domain-containing protein [Breoghania corrubedonensis]|uniref:Response regulator receiver domain-containing protein n=2 Tax=Breoghania corrubedonensis TaxID=665038 RepID=A0A2T5UYI2_9HYPH|nr:response regulator receiver domain-containing protein [Breoghania corrubedonensis]